MDKRGGGAPGGSSIVSCEVLHSRGGENDTRGGECPSPPPLKYGPACGHVTCVGLPDENGRVEILHIHTTRMRKNNKLATDVDVASIAKRTRNFSGAELEGLVRSAQATAMNKLIKVSAGEDELLLMFLSPSSPSLPPPSPLPPPSLPPPGQGQGDSDS